MQRNLFGMSAVRDKQDNELKLVNLEASSTKRVKKLALGKAFDGKKHSHLPQISHRPFKGVANQEWKSD